MFGLRKCAAAVIVLSMATVTNAAAQDAFMSVPGIPGESTVVGYVGWIELLSIRQNASSPTKKAVACDVSVVKALDSAGPALWATAAGGVILPEVQIAVLRATGEQRVRFYEIRLTQVRIGSVQATTGAGDPSESVTLLPQGVTLTYYPQLPTGQEGTPISQTFNCQ